MTDRPQPGSSGGETPSAAVEATQRPRRAPEPRVRSVAFTAYPKLLYIWPVIVAGFAFWPAADPSQTAAMREASPPTLLHLKLSSSQPAEAVPAKPVSLRLERLGWAYIWIAFIVVIALGVDLGRNQALVLLLLIAFVWVLGILLHDRYNFTLFGDIYRWLGAQDVQYDRGLALCLSILLAVPYVFILGWARLNDRWKITSNEFEHYSFGRSSESLGRGAKSIRSEFPDFFEALLGFGAGTLIVCDANGMRELRRISNVPMLPFVRKKLYRILERTAVTEAASEPVAGDDHV